MKTATLIQIAKPQLIRHVIYIGRKESGLTSAVEQFDYLLTEDETIDLARGLNFDGFDGKPGVAYRIFDEHPNIMVVVAAQLDRHLEDEMFELANDIRWSIVRNHFFGKAGSKCSVNSTTDFSQSSRRVYEQLTQDQIDAEWARRDEADSIVRNIMNNVADAIAKGFDEAGIDYANSLSVRSFSDERKALRQAIEAKVNDVSAYLDHKQSNPTQA